MRSIISVRQIFMSVDEAIITDWQYSRRTRREAAAMRMASRAPESSDSDCSLRFKAQCQCRLSEMQSFARRQASAEALIHGPAAPYRHTSRKIR